MSACGLEGLEATQAPEARPGPFWRSPRATIAHPVGNMSKLDQNMNTYEGQCYR